jgi:hypothetical protein
MQSSADARIERYLTDRLRFRWSDTGSIMERMRTLARVAGFDLDDRFAEAGLAAGPEARVAAGIVKCALGGNGASVSQMEMQRWGSRWVQTLRPKGRR